MIGFGLLVLSLALILSMLIPAPIGQPGVAGAEVTKPWWMFVWLFPAENALGVKGLLIVPSILGGLLALVPILDRDPYLSPSHRKALVISAALILIVIVASDMLSTLQPVAGNHLLQP